MSTLLYDMRKIRRDNYKICGRNGMEIGFRMNICFRRVTYLVVPVSDFAPTFSLFALRSFWMGFPIGWLIV